MIPTSRLLALLVSAVLVAGACSTGGAATSAPPAESPTAVPAATPDPDDLLALVKTAGTIRISTDPNYAPQSVLKPDGTYEGFDIDVANKIAAGLGVKVEFITPGWDTITAGSWGGRWDISVGSMTILADRTKVLDFSVPYYYTPAQLAATKASGITTLDGFAGKTICVGDSTTYQYWLEGTLDPAIKALTPPAGATAFKLPTDQNCAEAIQAGRTESDGMLTSNTVIEQAIGAGVPMVKVGDPVYNEELAVAIDKSGPPHADLVAAIDKIITDMHSDGTLKALSEKWFGVDLTTKVGE
ncbi:MAG: cystine ABC transporter cystine-binding protein [Chloroflexi bacterium CSP1-4]|nr:MAG: cystine ABC transporter cystine-binding protein [Chloroflexi bacterium CSP1-4]KRT64587.1 MAG: cystine ABC transporter cystine-binding protein [Chloroflexi bacterium CSP1-4]